MSGTAFETEKKPLIFSTRNQAKHILTDQNNTQTAGNDVTQVTQYSEIITRFNLVNLPVMFANFQNQRWH